MYTDEEIQEDVNDLVAEIAGIADPATLTVDTTLSSLNFDSLDRVELLLEIEEAFKIDISDQESTKWVVLGDIYMIVASLSE